MGKHKSWVWDFATRKGETAICLICDADVTNVFSCVGGSTGSIGNHLKYIHGKNPSHGKKSARNPKMRRVEDDISDSDEDVVEYILNVDEESNADSAVGDTTSSTAGSTSQTPQFATPSTSSSASSDALMVRRARRRRAPSTTTASGRLCTPERTEDIHRALTNMVAMSQLPLSFASSPGFAQFMATVEPNYKPCKEEALKRRLQLLKEQITEHIKKDFNAASYVACTSDCWTSRAQESYLTVTAHFINDKWTPRTVTLATQLMEERHTANLSAAMENVLREWGIANKTAAMVTDNASNVVNAVRDMSCVQESKDLTCSAHTLQLAAGKALAHPSVAKVCQKSSKIVGHFRHSNVATTALKAKQGQLNMTEQKLIQSVATRWNSSFEMLERLGANRIPISNVLADRSVTTPSTAQRLEMTEQDWLDMGELVQLLKPLQMATTVFCGDRNSPISMVRPLIIKIVDNHMSPLPDDSDLTTEFKALVANNLTHRFHLDMNDQSEVGARLIASFLDPRHKDLRDEAPDVRGRTLSYVREMSERSEGNTDVEDEDGGSEMEVVQNNALAYLYQQPVRSKRNVATQLQKYTAEPELRFDLNHLDWWKAREHKYPAVASLAKKYLCIPATSASAERTFSTAGNIVTPKRNCLKPENVDLLVFLFQNKTYYNA